MWGGHGLDSRGGPKIAINCCTLRLAALRPSLDVWPRRRVQLAKELLVLKGIDYGDIRECEGASEAKAHPGSGRSCEAMLDDGEIDASIRAHAGVPMRSHDSRV